MGMSREAMDEAVNAHFGYEATDNLDGVMASLADDVEHEVIPSPAGAQRDRGGIRALYAAMFENLKGESATPIRRYYGDDFMIDETLWTGEILDGGVFNCPGKSGRTSFRLLHVFEFRDGRISREQAWLDLATIQKQLGAATS